MEIFNLTANLQNSDETRKSIRTPIVETKSKDQKRLNQTKKNTKHNS